MKRQQLIQYLINTYNLSSYLEIGIQYGHTFNVINCKSKVGVDPNVQTDESKGLFRLTSDEFFSKNEVKFDIVFIDGLHLYEQTIRDIVNAWNCSQDIGFIVIHDCFPTIKEMCQRHIIIPEWTGDVWKAVVWFRDAYPEVNVCVLDMDYGCGVIEVNKSKTRSKLEFPNDTSFYASLNFEWLQSHLERVNLSKRYAGFHCNT